MISSLFLDYLQEIRTLHALPPDSAEYSERLRRLLKDVPDEAVETPESRRWFRITLISAVIMLACFISLAIMAFRGGWNTLYSGFERELLLGLAAMLFLSEIIFCVFSLMESRYQRKAKLAVIHCLGARLNGLSDREFLFIRNLLANLPEYAEAEADPTSSDSFGCLECMHVFPAVGAYDYAALPFICPRCGGCFRIVFGDEHFPVTEEILRTMHDLFIEEN